MTRPVNTAVILAAGMGTRLGETGRNMPKGFLQLGGRPIVEESVLRLAEAGIDRIVIVTGHLRDRYEALADEYSELVRTVHNPRFAESGSLYSLACARADLTDDFLLLESDLVYEQRALSMLQEFGRDAVLLSGPTQSGDEVWVSSVRGLLADMSKDRESLKNTVEGELVGISRISRNFFSGLMEYALPRLHKDQMLEYETGGLVPAARRHPLPCLLVSDLLWAEIDDEAHLERARNEVYPAIVALDGVPRSQTSHA